MMNTSPFPQLKDTFKEEDWSWIFPSLRQDPNIWITLTDSEFLTGAINKFGNRPKHWSPANLALLILGVDVPVEDLSSLQTYQQSQETIQKYSAEFELFMGETPPEMDFYQASLLALYLYNHPEAPKPLNWKTSLACLFGMIADRFDFLTQLDPVTTVHVILTQPYTPEELKKLFGKLLTKVDIDFCLEILQELSCQRPDLSKSIAQDLLSENPTVAQLDGYENTNTTLRALKTNLYQATLFSIARNQDENVRENENAWKETEKFRINLATRIIISKIDSHYLNEALDFWRSNKNIMGSEQVAEIIIALYKNGNIEEGMEWFDHESISRLETDSGTPLNYLANSIIKLYQGDPKLAYEEACLAMDGYSKLPFRNFSHIYQLARLFLSLDKPSESAQTSRLALDYQPNNIDVILHLMRSLQKTKDRKSVIETAHLAVSLAPDQVEYRRVLADWLEKDEQWLVALGEREAIICHQESVDTADYYLLADCALQADQPQRSATLCHQLLSTNDENVEAHRILGNAYLALGDPQKAKSHLIKATQLSPSSGKSWISLANLYDISDKKDKKKETLLSASNAIPDNPEIKYALAREYVKEKAFTQALHLLQEAVTLAKTSESAVDPIFRSGIAEDLGKIQFKLGHTADSLNTLEEAYRADPHHIGISHNYAKVLISKGLSNQALDILSEVRRQAPDNVELCLDYSKACLINSRQLEEAKNCLLDVLNTNPYLDEAKALLAQAYELLQEYTLAQEAYREAINSQLIDDPEWNAQISLGLGRTSIKLNQPQIAIAALNNALISQKDNIDLLQILSEAYQAADLNEKALSVARNVLEAASDNEDIIDWYIKQAISLDALDKAIEALEEAIEIDPEKILLQTKLGWLHLHEGDADTAWKAFSLVKAMDQVSPSDLYKISQGFLAVNDPTSAIECLDKAISYLESTAEDSEFQQLVFTKATAQQLAGDLEAALATIEGSIAKIQITPEIIEKKSKILFDLQREEEAIDCLQKGIVQFPHNEKLRIQLVTIFRAVGDIPKAAKHALSIINLAGTPQGLSFTPSKSAIIADLADAMLQKKFAKGIVENAAILESEPSPGDLDYYCLMTKLALDNDEDILAANAITSALKIDPQHPRVLALQARTTSRQGDLNTAEEILKRALKNAGYMYKGYSPSDLGDLKDGVKHPASTFLDLADVCVLFHNWSAAIFLFHETIKAAPNEPRSHFALARALVQRAEFQRLCQQLEVVTNAPGSSAVAEFAYRKFEEAILKAAHFLSDIDTQSEGTTSFNNEPKSLIATWLARGQAIFQPSNEHTEVLSKLAPTPNNQAATIAAQRHCRNTNKAITTSQAIYNNEKAITNPSLLGQIALAMSKESPEIANKAIQTAIKVSNWFNKIDQPIYYAIQAEIANQNEDTDSQLQALESALEIWPEEPRWLAKAADLLLKKYGVKEDKRVIHYLEKATTLEPKLVGYHIKLAEIYQRCNQPEEALHVLERATHVNPKKIEPWMALAKAYQQSGDIPQTIRCAKMVIQIDPEETGAYLLLAEVALKVDNPQKAFKYLDEVLSKDPENNQAFLLRSRTYKAIQKPEEALSSMDKALQNMFKSVSIQLERVDLIRQARGEEDALIELEVLNQDQPENPYILSALAEAQTLNGKHNDAIQTAQNALSKAHDAMDEQDTAKLLQLLGRLLRKSGQLDQAIHYLSEAVELSPNYHGPFIDLGRCYQEQRQYDRALQHLQHAISISPDDSQAYYYAGQIFKETQDYENAEFMFRKAASLSPNDLNIHRQLGAVMAINLVHSSQEEANLSVNTGRFEP